MLYTAGIRRCNKEKDGRPTGGFQWLRFAHQWMVLEAVSVYWVRLERVQYGPHLGGAYALSDAVLARLSRESTPRSVALTLRRAQT
jgi:hypothetical protein